MSVGQSSPPAAACPPTRDGLRQQAHQRLDEIIAYCLSVPGPPSFLEFETALLGLLRSLGGLLIQLFLRARHDEFDTTAWTRDRGYRVADPAAGRALKTSCGSVAYVRALLVPRHGGGPGVHPLDVALGLTRDAYSPLVIGWFCRLATRVSFHVASGLGGMFLGAAPPASAVEEWVLGLARSAYVYLSDGPGSSGLKCEPRALSSSSDLEGSALNHNLIHLIDSCRGRPWPASPSKWTYRQVWRSPLTSATRTATASRSAGPCPNAAAVNAAGTRSGPPSSSRRHPKRSATSTSGASPASGSTRPPSTAVGDATTARTSSLLSSGRTRPTPSASSSSCSGR